LVIVTVLADLFAQLKLKWRWLFAQPKAGRVNAERTVGGVFRARGTTVRVCTFI
jgi:hypothetical protein